MGSWNSTCATSNLHIHLGQKVAVFMLLENQEKKSFCYSNALYDLCPIPFYGEYNSYGAVDSTHGFGLPLVIDAIKDRLYEFGQGPNSSHDIIVRKSDFDENLMFEADHEDRLGIEEHMSWNNDSYQHNALERQRDEKELTSDQQFELDRLAAKLKKVDTFRRVTHVVIHGDIFNDIMKKWYIESYVGEHKGTEGYNNCYTHTYFKDIVDSIPDYVNACKKDFENSKKDENPGLTRLMKGFGTDHSARNSTNLATRWITNFDRNSNSEYGLINVKKYITEYIDAENWDDLALFVKEALTGAWVNAFMVDTRKLWTRQTGLGSQSSVHLGYNVLINSMTNILKAEEEEFGE